MARQTKRFLDSVRMFAVGGTGGVGQPKYGGTGGKGGDVIIQCTEDFSLIQTKRFILSKTSKGGLGQNSRKFRLLGNDGKDLIIPAPPGIVVKTNYGRTIGELNVKDDRVLAAAGGLGGNLSNQYFGRKGEGRHLQLLLKLIADIGLVGFPNAGKSTFLRAISRAKPKVANYPFTTLHPTIGSIEFDDGRRISMADLPGLIEGAWTNTGMGHSFLRHIERTKLLLFVVDIEGFQLSPLHPKRSPIENVILLNRELELYQPFLVEKPAILAVNKMDCPGAEERLNELKDQLKDIERIANTLEEEARPKRFVEFTEVVPCAAKYDRSSINRLKNMLRTALDVQADLEYAHNETLEIACAKTISKLQERTPKLL